jgi:DNA (cytosine-5)-methyltransferase 1
MNGLSLFSGIGGLDIALAPWVRPVAYCENDRYAQSVLLSRMHSGALPSAAIWDDVTTLQVAHLGNEPIDVIYGGFPCQDISVAGRGAGLEGKRSGLFFEVLRLAEEVQPKFIFLENVPAIRTRGADRVVEELSALGYDCRWDTLSAASVGAPHLRNRWWLLAAHPQRLQLRDEQGRSSRPSGGGQAIPRDHGQEEFVAHSPLPRLEGEGEGVPRLSSWWAVEPDVGRVAHGVPARVDRIRGLGNAVVPAQARAAFMRLAGI